MIATTSLTKHVSVQVWKQHALLPRLIIGFNDHALHVPVHTALIAQNMHVRGKQNEEIALDLNVSVDQVREWLR